MKKINITICLLLMAVCGFSQTWTAQTSGTANNLKSIWMYNANFGYAVGAGGKILKTTNGGTYWNTETSNATADLNSFALVSTTPTWVYCVVGNGGLILACNSGSWAAKALGQPTNNLNSVYFVDANNGYACGNGVIFKITITSGNWAISNTTISAGNNFKSICFTSLTTGYVVDTCSNGKGYVYKTTNSGANWSTFVTTGITRLNSIFFTDVNTGYAVGSAGKIIKTTNAGANWTALSSITGTALNSVFFINATTGYVVGNTGVILKTTDAGTNWISENSGTTNNLNSVYFPTTDVGYVCGNGGTILKYLLGVNINESKADEFGLYPNPAKDKITITNTGGKEMVVSIYNMLGEMVMTNSYNNKTSVEVDLSGLVKGIYMVKVETEMGVGVKRVVVK